MNFNIDMDWRIFYAFVCPRCTEIVKPTIIPEPGDPWICHSCGALGQWGLPKTGSK